MIKVVCEDYCQNCSNFEVDVKRDVCRTFTETFCDTHIFCEHRQKCALMYDYLKRKSGE